MQTLRPCASGTPLYNAAHFSDSELQIFSPSSRTESAGIILENMFKTAMVWGPKGPHY